jgi:hypothetical protein
MTVISRTTEAALAEEFQAAFHSYIRTAPGRLRFRRRSSHCQREHDARSRAMDSEQFADIYSQADDAFRAATKQQDFLDFISAVHRKLGKVQNASQGGYFVNFSTSGTQVRLNYRTKFEGGDAQEEFIWKIKGNQAVLVGYHINSNALVTK